MHEDEGFHVIARAAHPATTLEVRWIRRGSVPEEMIRWLRPFASWIEQREDRYLLDATTPAFGLKIKDSVQLDLKTARGDPARLKGPDWLRGRVELWDKWSFPVHAGAIPPAEAEGWLGLRKTRRCRSFETVDGEAVERPIDQAELPGCSVELTEVVVEQEVWWTLGLEATGSIDVLEANLQTTISALFREPPPIPGSLDLRHSMSYARWIHARWR